MTVNPFGENVYILWDEDTLQAVVVDPGMMREDECDMVAKFIEDNHLQVSHVLLTHAHLDHACGARWLADHTGAQVWGSLLDADLARALPAQVQAFHLKIQAEPLAIDQPLHDGDVIAVGSESIHVLQTPGHTPGGLSFYLPNSGLLMAGDTIFNGSVGRVDLPGGDFEQLITSIHNKILPLPDETVIAPGHGLTTTVGDEKRHNPFL